MEEEYLENFLKDLDKIIENETSLRNRKFML